MLHPVGRSLLTSCSCLARRKFGLFKKSYELSVLCRVDVTVIVKDEDKFFILSGGGVIPVWLELNNDDSACPPSKEEKAVAAARIYQTALPLPTIS